MLRRIQPGIILIGMICFTFNLNAQKVYVSPNGNDANNGLSSTSPVQSFLKGAGIAKSLGAQGVIVEFADGTYIFDSTAILDASYSGISFKAASGANPVFSSLKKVDNWTVHNGNIMVANLPSGINHVRYLQDKSENWMERSAGNYFNPEEQSTEESNEEFTYDDGIPQLRKSYTKYPSSWTAPDWTHASQYDIRSSSGAWLLNVLPISHVDLSNRQINLSSPATYEIISENLTPPLTEVWILNTIEGIDSPGEWACLNGQIYLYPKSGTSDIYVPALTELIKIDAGGDGNTWNGNPVSNIHFEGITFTGCDYLFTGAPPAAVTTQHDWGLIDQPASALRIRNASNCSVKNCTFTKSGSGGIRLDRFAQNIQIDQCDFNYLGRECVLLGGRGPGHGDVNKNNEITNCTMKTPGREKWDCPAINISQSSNNRIEGNFIQDTYMSAIIMTSSRSVYMAFKADGADAYFNGRECFYWEVASSVLTCETDGTCPGPAPAQVEAQKFLYLYNNKVVKNVFTNIHNINRFHNPVSLTNGILYVSGTKRHETNELNSNYFYDINPTNNTQLLYADSYQDNLEVKKNMIYNLQIADSPIENHPVWDYNGWYEDGQNYGGRGFFQSNIIDNSTFTLFLAGIGSHWQSSGNIDFSLTEPIYKGESANLNDYIEMYLLLCQGQLPGPSVLPGAAQLQSKLAQKIVEFGGTVPTCALSASDQILATKKINLYPNPVKNRIHFENENESIIDVQIFTSTGRSVKSIRDVKGIFSLDVSMLPPALYLIQIKTDSGDSYESKFIKE